MSFRVRFGIKERVQHIQFFQNRFVLGENVFQQLLTLVAAYRFAFDELCKQYAHGVVRGFRVTDRQRAQYDLQHRIDVKITFQKKINTRQESPAVAGKHAPQTLQFPLQY